MEKYIADKENLYKMILQFIENSVETDDDSLFYNLSETIKNQIADDPDEMQQFLQTIKCISDNHHRNRNFNYKINRILSYYKDQIKQNMTNIDIYIIKVVEI